MRLKITLPSSIKDLPEHQRKTVVTELEKALDITGPDRGGRSMWDLNDEPMLAQAEEELFSILRDPMLENAAALIAALGLCDAQADVTKSLTADQQAYDQVLIKARDNGQHKISDLIERSNTKRKDFLKYIQDGSAWTRSKLKQIEAILKQKLPDYASIAERFVTRAAFLAKIRNKAEAEALTTLGAYVDRFPDTIKAAERKGVVLTLKEKQAAEAAGQKVKILPLQPQEVRAVQHAELRTSEKLTEVSDRHRAAIKQTVLHALNGRWSAQQLAQALLDQFGDQDRDWRRVSVTELSMAYNDAYLAGCEEGSTVWIPPVEGSCKYCKQYLEGKTFIVTHDATKMGNTQLQEMQYVWPGKTNYGRKVATYVPCIPLHPCCRHRYVRLSKFYKVVDGKPVLKTSKELIQEELRRKGLPPDPNLV